MTVNFQLPSIKTIYGSPLEELCEKYQLKETKTADGSNFTVEAIESAASASGAKAPQTDSLLGRCVILAANFAYISPEEIGALEAENQALVADSSFQLFSRTIAGAESLFSKKQRIWKKAERLTLGLGNLFKEAILIKDSYWQEVLLESHPYGADIGDYFDVWSMSKTMPYSFEDFMSLKPLHLRPKSSVQYLTEAEKKGMEIEFIDGKLYLQGAPLDTSKIPTDKEEGFAIYVLSCDFRMFVGPYLVGKFHHSSFTNGGPVLGAGEIQTAPDGTLILISSKSGHYKPTAMQFHNTLQFLESHGVELSKVGLIENGSSGSLKKYPSVTAFRESTPSPTKSLRIRTNTASPAGLLIAGGGGGGLSPSKGMGLASPAFFMEGASSPHHSFTVSGSGSHTTGRASFAFFEDGSSSPSKVMLAGGGGGVAPGLNKGHASPGFFVDEHPSHRKGFVPMEAIDELAMAELLGSHKITFTRSAIESGASAAFKVIPKTLGTE